MRKKDKLYLKTIFVFSVYRWRLSKKNCKYLLGRKKKIMIRFFKLMVEKKYDEKFSTDLLLDYTSFSKNFRFSSHSTDVCRSLYIYRRAAMQKKKKKMENTSEEAYCIVREWRGWLER